MTMMKSSNTEWLGDIPAEWDVAQIGNYYELRNEKVSDYDFEPLSVTMKGIVPQLATAAKSDDHSNRKLVKKGDFVINSRSDRRGSCGISPLDGSVSLINTVMEPRGEMNPQYYNWLFHTEQFADEFYKWGHGIVDDLWTTRWQEMKKILIVAPSPDEQQAIADYLDETCSKIDEIIAEAKASIDEYKELKQSVIFEAVTKGLDKNVEMKEIDGWIRWLPKGWNFRKINGLFNVIGSGTTPKSSIEEYYQGTINWLQSGDINGTVVKNTKKHISDEIVENTSALVVYDAPFIAIAMYGASIGNISIVDINACTNQACCVLSQPTKYIDMVYSFWCIMSAKEELLLSSRGGGQPNISQNIIKQLRIPLPPLMEQRKIADYLNDKTKEIDSLIAEKECLINDLEAYKKSLIYEVVTGKRRVV